MKPLSVVIVTKDRPGEAETCIRSVKPQLDARSEILVVDAGSTETREVCKRLNVRYLREPRPGRCAARNLGIARAKSDIIVFLDDDVIAWRGCMKRIAAAFSDAHIAAVGGVERRPPSQEQNKFLLRRARTGAHYTPEREHRTAAWYFEHLITTYLNPFGASREIAIRHSGRVTGSFKERSTFGDARTIARITRAGHLKGFCMAFRKHALIEIGGFDEQYTGIGHREETDVCYRLGKRGYALVVDPGVQCIHYNASSGKPSGKRDIGFERHYSMNKQHQYFVFKNGIITRGGIPEYVFGELIELARSFVWALFARDIRFFFLMKAKLEGIREGIRARHAKGDQGDLR